MLPVPACRTSTGGRPEAHPRRAVWDAIRYVNDSGCKWRALPQDFPPFQTVFGFFSRWSQAGVFNLIRDQLRRPVRIAMGASPHGVAVAIDSQSGKAAATVPRSTSGYDPGKKTSDAENVSSGEGETGFWRGREGYGLVERDAVSQAVVEAADHSVEEVPLGGRVSISGLTSAVVVSPRPI